jgi:hypothetical protein
MDRIINWTVEGQWGYWLYWTLPISLSWFMSGLIAFRRRIFVPQSFLNATFVSGSIIFAFSPLLLGVALIFLFGAIIVPAGLIMVVYDPKNLWVGLPVTFCLWLYCHWRGKNNDLAKAIAATLAPWLVAMTVAESMFLAALAWLPRTEWHWLYLTGWAASEVDLLFAKILPSSVLVNLGIIAILLGFNICLPRLTFLTKGFQRLITIAHKIAVGVSFFCGITFFGAGQASAVADSTAQERYDRLKDQSDSAAQLSLAARITDDLTQETTNIHDLFDSIHQAVKDDMDLDYDFSEYPIRYRHGGDLQTQEKDWEHRRLRFFVERRVDELRKAIESNRRLLRTASVLREGIFEKTARLKITEEQKRDAEEQYDKALDVLGDKVKDVTFHPLSEALKSAGFSELAGDIVKEVYNYEVSRMARDLSEPLADALFRSDEISKDSLVAKFSAISDRPVFDEESLPKSVWAPTSSDRFEEKERSENPVKAVEKAIEVK